MIGVLLIGCALVAVTVFIHAAGCSLVMRSLARSPSGIPTRYWPVTWLLIRVVWLLIMFHLAEITVAPQVE